MDAPRRSLGGAHGGFRRRGGEIVSELGEGFAALHDWIFERLVALFILWRLWAFSRAHTDGISQSVHELFPRHSHVIHIQVFPVGICARQSQSSQSFAFSFVRAFAFASVRSNDTATKSIPHARTHARTVSKHSRQRRVMHANQLEPFRLAFALCRFAIPVPNPSQRASILCASSVQMRDEIDHRVRSVIIRRKHRDPRATSVRRRSSSFPSVRPSVRSCRRRRIAMRSCSRQHPFAFGRHEVKRRRRRPRTSTNTKICEFI